MAEFKMAASIKLSENEGLWVRLNWFESEFCAKWLNPRWLTSRWLPSSSWVRMNEVESDWIMLSQSQIGSESVFEWIWEMITRCLNPRWQCLNPTWQNFKIMAAIIKLSQNEWVKLICAKWQCLNLIWPNWRWLPSSSWVRMKEFESDWISLSQSFVQNGWIQDGWIQYGRIQDGCHHQVKWEWMSLSQIELVWFRVRLEWECFWVNRREDNKVSESKMAVSEFNMVEFKMAPIIKLSPEWMSEVFLCKWWEPFSASVSECER